LTSMRLIKKFIIVSGLFLCIIVIILSGMGIYLYYHPERIKPMVERSLAAATGASCTMESLSFSLRPLAVEAGGILFETLKPEQASSLEIPFIRTDMAIEGPWGRRSLILKNMGITGIFMNGKFAILPGKTGSSFPARMVRGIVSLFFFRDIRFESGEILDGKIVASWGDQTIQARHIHAEAGADKPLFVSFAMEVNNSFRNMHIKVPNVNLISNNRFDINDFKFNGTLQAEDITLEDAAFGIKKMDVLSKFTYSHAHKNLKAEDFQLRINGLALVGTADGRMPPIDVSLKAEGISSRHPVIEITNVTLQILRAKVRTKTRDILMGDIRFTIPDGRMDTENGTIALPNIRCDAFGLKNLLLAVDIRNEPKDDSINLVFQGKKTALLHAAAAYQLLPPDWELSAEDTVRIEVAGPKAGPWQMRANLSFEDLAFQNKDGSLMGENISLATRTQGVIDLKDSTMTFAAAVEVNTGEALYDRYYVNLAKNPVISSCNGTYAFQQKFLRLSKLTFVLTDILPLEIKGSFKQGPSIHDSGRDADFTVTIPQTPLQPIFYHLLQEPYKTKKPFLATLETGGTVSAEFTVKEFQNTRQVTGRIGWRDGNLTLKDKGASLTGIDLDLPVWYKTGSAEIPAESLKGRIEIQSMALPPLPEQPFSIVLDSGPNRISIGSPTVIQVPGGDLRLGSVQAQNIFGPDMSIHTRLAIDGINTQSLLSGIGALPPEGTLAGALTGILDPVRYENQAVTSQGQITAAVFGGKIVFSDLGASGIFTSAPVFKLNALWDDLLLTEITTDTTFGKIEGVLKGHIRDGEIAYGQPQRFDLLLETVQKKGFPQTISIKAVDNIAQIGSGQSPFIGLAGAFASIFEKFPYEKIGIRARLENDMFTINGTIIEGGTEYMVKRRGLSGVNIINQNPDNRINFKDMVKRIQRITHKGGAVIN